MQRQKKVRRLLEAIDEFNSFNHIVDMLALGLFVFTGICFANKVLAKKLVDFHWFDQSWTTIVVLTFIFAVIFTHQLESLNRRRELSEFEKEAAIKANRRKKRRF